MRVSVTDLDSFRRYREQEEMSLADLMKILRREEPPSVKMLAGKALHKLLETVQDGNLTEAVSEGHRFRFTLDAELPIGHSREMRGTRDYLDGLLTLSGRVDQIDGITIDDHKLTQNFDAERYYARYQWRCYLSIFGAYRFNYNVFVGAPAKGEQDVWEIRDFHRLTLYRYPELEVDVARECALFYEFAIHHDLPLKAA